MALTIRLEKNVLQRDRFNPPDPQEEEAEIVIAKRVVVQGVAENGKARANFEVRLDLRSRLLQVEVLDGDPQLAEEIANALVNEMASFTTVPRGALLVKRGSLGLISEWVVRDPNHGQGLLHRLKESKKFVARTGPPQPPGYQQILDELLRAVKENLDAIYAEKKNRSGKSWPIAIALPFDTFTWLTLRSRFLELCEDLDLQLKFARFFDAISHCERAAAILRENPKSSPDYGTRPNVALRNATAEYAGQLEEPTIQVGLKLLLSHEKAYELAPYLRTQ